MAAQRVKLLDVHGRVTVVPSQKPGLGEAVGLTHAQLERYAWAIEPDGRRHHGGAAIVAALAWATGRRRLEDVYYLPGLGRVGDAVYALVAANRGRLPGVVPYCRQHPEECGGG